MAHSSRTVCKTFLLDEQDAVGNLADQIDSFEHLSEVMEELLIEDIGWPDFPSQSVIAIASERFNFCRSQSGETGGEIIRNNATWNDTVSGACCRFGKLDSAIMNRFLENENVDLLSNHLKTLLTKQLKNEDYDGAQEHLCALEHLRDAGLPCFQPLNHYSRGGGTGLFDARSKNFGKGTRVLVEILQTW